MPISTMTRADVDLLTSRRDEAVNFATDAQFWISEFQKSKVAYDAQVSTYNKILNNVLIVG